MTDGSGDVVRQPAPTRGRWTSFVADAPHGDRPVRTLREDGAPAHRARVEHDGSTVLVHLADPDGGGWTCLAVDRASRAWSVAQRDVQLDAAASACRLLYEGSDPTSS